MPKRFPLPKGSIERARVRDRRATVDRSMKKKNDQGFHRYAFMVHADDIERTKKYVTRNREKKLKELGLA